MFPTSSQRRYWTFKTEDEIRKHREKHNQEFRQYHGDRLGLNVIKTRNAINFSPFKIH